LQTFLTDGRFQGAVHVSASLGGCESESFFILVESLRLPARDLGGDSLEYRVLSQRDQDLKKALDVVQKRFSRGAEGDNGYVEFSDLLYQNLKVGFTGLRHEGKFRYRTRARTAEIGLRHKIMVRPAVVPELGADGDLYEFFKIHVSVEKATPVDLEVAD